MSKSPSKKLSTDIMDLMLRDPAKRALILQIINQEKHNIEKYKQNELTKKTTPLKKMKNVHCESPTSLQRRRALQQNNQDISSASSSSEASESNVDVNGPKVPFDQLLKGVKAYIEVRRDNTDRSEGIKAVMSLMGATVSEKFTNDVTHVVFKDGSFTTYEKAKLMRKHLVSVLWLDAVRRNNARVPEKNYPAFGNKVCDANVSILCSQIQKDYEDIIKDEKRRRHTVGPQTSLSSYITAQNLNYSENESSAGSKSPELTSDDSDCGIVNGYIHKRSKDDILTDVNSEITDKPKNNTNSSLDSSSSISLLNRAKKSNRKTINVISDMSLTPNCADQSTVNQNEAKSSSENSLPQSSVISSLRLSDSDKTKSDLANSKDTSKTRSSLLGGKNVSLKTVNSTMSSLRLSESPSRNKKTRESKSSNSSDKVISKTPEIEPVKKLTRKSARKAITNAVDSEQENFFGEASNSGSKSSTRNKAERQALKSTDSRSNTPKKARRKLLDSSESDLEESPPKKADRSLKSSSTSKLDQTHEASTRSLSSEVSKSTDKKSAKKTRRSLKNLSDLEKLTIRQSLSKDISDSEKKSQTKTVPVKKTRKLYNPNDLTDLAEGHDEEEREEYLKAKSQKSPDGPFLNPNDMQVSSAPPKRKQPKSAKSINEISELNTPSRRSQRLTLSQSKPKYTFSSSESSASLLITPIKRRSTLDFVTLTQSQQKRKLKLDPKRATSIVCTKMHRPQVLNFEKIVISLGKFFVEDKVTGKTTHLVVGEAKRTINMLRAIARGCWILKHEWLLKSHEMGRWLNEEDYELTEFSPAVQQCRLQREAFGSLYSMDIFKDCGFIYVGKSTTPKPAELKELISICKGRITTAYRNAVISVGEFIDREEVTSVNEMWVLDSIHFNKLKSVKKYLLKPERHE